MVGLLSAGGARLHCRMAVALLVCLCVLPVVGGVSPPFNLIITDENCTAVSLIWTPSADPDLAGYDVFRGSVCAGSVSQPQDWFVDGGKTVYRKNTYRVRAYNQSGVRSSFTSEVVSSVVCPVWSSVVSPIAIVVGSGGVVGFSRAVTSEDHVVTAFNIVVSV